ncbi:MAG: DUF3536 domain-containing protein, partial [Chloroflexota bacterium]
QDRINLEAYGAGNAMAQAYNHTILPLASHSDKVTQVVWGIADFEHRFNRKPQGMWLPETAADLETLQVLADQGIEFTILAPWQSSIESIDTTEPYKIALARDRSISVFFYNAELSSRVSFDPGATINADAFAGYQVAPRFSREKTLSNEPQIILVASDGELYGHHQKFRDIFLAHLVNGASTLAGINITYPALWLKNNPPRRTVTIRERTSWSCHHGVMRWMGECACTHGDGVWKAYMRRSFDRLAAALEQAFVDCVSPHVPNPIELRHRYIHVILRHQTARDLICEMAGRSLDDDTIGQIHLLLEAQRERQRMFTSCGWFFDDFGRIEPKNNVAYAAQAVRLTRLATGIDLSTLALADLQHVISHHSGIRGDIIFRKQIQRAERPLA